MSRVIYSLPDAFEAGPAVVGGKAFGLARLARYGFAVPQTLALGADLYRAVLQQDGPARALTALRAAPEDADRAEALANALRGASLPEAARREIEAALAAAGLADAPLAVRSSATAEDGAVASFAGQHETFLKVQGMAAIEAAVLGCFASLWRPGAIAYRRRFGFALDEVAMGVVLCAMVEAEAAGVAFTADPASGRRDLLVVEAVSGLAEDLVRGRAQGCHTLLSRRDLSVIEGTGGPLPDEALARLGRLLNRLHWSLGDGDVPQDAEWVYDGTDFVFVQARPVTAMPHAGFPERAGEPVIWSNANLREVLAEIPTPMSWSLMELSIPQMVCYLPHQSGYPLPEGLRLIRRYKGRCYGDLSAMQWMWYDGFGQPPADTNESLGGHQGRIALPEKEGLAVRFTRLRRSLRVFKLLRGQEAACEEASAALLAKVRAFRSEDLSKLSDEALRAKIWEFLGGTGNFMPVFSKGAGICALEGMILEKSAKRILGDEAGRALAQSLMAGSDGSGSAVESADHALRLRDLAALARKDPQAAAILAQGRLPEQPGDGPFEAALRDYLRLFGHRGVGELDISQPRWAEDPGYILSQVAALLNVPEAEGAGGRSAERREEALARVPWYRRRGLRKLAAKAQRGMALRERVKSAIVGGTEPLRRLVLEAARRFVERGQMATVEDVFWLALPEFFALQSGSWDGTGLQDLIAERRARHAAWKAEKVPAVFEERPDGGTAERAVAGVVQGDALRGYGAYPGQYRGVARVLCAPTEGAKLRQGEIMVAPFTDPTWTPLFLRAGALVLEIGGSMSHGVIVARELGIPTVVNIPGLLDRVRDGETLVVDGARGLVRKVAQEGGVEGKARDMAAQ